LLGVENLSFFFRRFEPLPICPKCRSAHLTQSADPSKFKCPSCSSTFKVCEEPK
jgi:tRNA(Ile2) C34 agmatinyltransferase TiaS